MRPADIDLLKEVMPDLIDSANGIVFFKGEPMEDAITSVVARFGTTRPDAEETLKKLVKIQDGELIAK